MKNFLLSFLIILVLVALVQMFLPWWSMVIVAVLVGFLFPNKGGYAFLAGFLALFTLWAGYTFMLSSANNHLLANMMAELLQPLTQGNRAVLFLLTGLLGGLVAGMGALTGNYAAKLKQT